MLLTEAEKNKKLKEKEKAQKQKEKEKALKQKEKEKAQKQKEKAKSLKQKEKAKALKAKEKVKYKIINKNKGGGFPWLCSGKQCIDKRYDHFEPDETLSFEQNIIRYIHNYEKFYHKKKEDTDKDWAVSKWLQDNYNNDYKLIPIELCNEKIDIFEKHFKYSNNSIVDFIVTKVIAHRGVAVLDNFLSSIPSKEEMDSRRLQYQQEQDSRKKEREKRMEEHKKRMEEHNKRMEEHNIRMEEYKSHEEDRV
jgi:hypothetical protein